LIIANAKNSPFKMNLDSQRKQDLAAQWKMSHLNMTADDCVQKCTLTRSWPKPNDFVGLKDSKHFDNKLCPFSDGWLR